MANATLLRIDESRQEVFVKGKRVFLTPKEFKVFLALKKTNRTLTRVQLLEHMCDGDESFEKDTRTVDQHVSHIRRKLRKYTNKPMIETAVTFGYKFVGA